jgi:glycosyltransferase involved in cell wall biosynthesis
VIPLRDKETNCGHISIVGSLLLGKPLVTTFSDGTVDYIFPDKNALVSPPQNPEYLKNNIYKLWTDSFLYQRLSEMSLKIAKEKHHETVWINYLKNYLQKLK